MAQTEQQIAKDNKKRYVYYDEDGNLQVANQNSQGSVTVNGEQLTPGSLGAAVLFPCTETELQASIPLVYTELKPEKPAWVRLKELHNGGLTGPLAIVKITSVEDDSAAKMYGYTISYQYVEHASIKTDHKHWWSRSITLPKTADLCQDSCSANDLKNDINSYQIGYDEQGKLDIKKSSSSNEGYTQLNCNEGFQKLSCDDIKTQVRTFQKVNSNTPLNVASQTINDDGMNLKYQAGVDVEELDTSNDITITDQGSEL